VPLIYIIDNVIDVKRRENDFGKKSKKNQGFMHIVRDKFFSLSSNLSHFEAHNATFQVFIKVFLSKTRRPCILTYGCIYELKSDNVWLLNILG
jgi:hypothetical protein